MYKVVLSGIGNLKAVRFLKLVLRYDYSIVYNWQLGNHNAEIYAYVHVDAFPFLCLNLVSQHCNKKCDRLRLSPISSALDKKTYKIIQECYIILAGLLKIAVIFTGLGFYGITKIQQYL